MKKFFVLVLVLALGLIFAGCAQKAATKSEQPMETAQKAAAVETEKKVEPAAPAKEESKKVETVAVKEVEAKSASSFENIHFDFDKYNIRDDAKPALKSTADWLVKNKSSKMLIEGHCDERGTSEYNLALGERRAKSTRDYLVSSGVTKDRLDMVSYGKEKPLCSEHNEDCWQKNRRAQFTIKGAAK